MGLKGEVDVLSYARQKVAVRPAAAYGIAANTIFTISGGPVMLMALFGHVITAIVAAPTATFTVSGVAVDSGAVVVTSGVNTFIVCPLDDAGIAAVVPNVAATNILAADPLVAVPGNIVVTIAVAPTGGTIAWYCVYYSLGEVAIIT